MAQSVTFVEERLAHCQVPFCGDAHDQEGLPAQEDVLDWIQEVWEEEDIDWRNTLGADVNDIETEEHDVTNSKSDEALMKC